MHLPGDCGDFRNLFSPCFNNESQLRFTFRFSLRADLDPIGYYVLKNFEVRVSTNLRRKNVFRVHDITQAQISHAGSTVDTENSEVRAQMQIRSQTLRKGTLANPNTL